jgi:hypothetical protein
MVLITSRGKITMEEVDDIKIQGNKINLKKLNQKNKACIFLDHFQDENVHYQFLRVIKFFHETFSNF